MLKSESLIQLVNNLTKQEKKEFSLYITNKSEKDYIFLFRLIDDKKIEKTFIVTRGYDEKQYKEIKEKSNPKLIEKD